MHGGSKAFAECRPLYAALACPAATCSRLPKSMKSTSYLGAVCRQRIQQRELRASQHGLATPYQHAAPRHTPRTRCSAGGAARGSPGLPRTPSPRWRGTTAGPQSSAPGTCRRRAEASAMLWAGGAEEMLKTSGKRWRVVYRATGREDSPASEAGAQTLDALQMILLRLPPLLPCTTGAHRRRRRVCKGQTRKLLCHPGHARLVGHLQRSRKEVEGVTRRRGDDSAVSATRQWAQGVHAPCGEQPDSVCVAHMHSRFSWAQACPIHFATFGTPTRVPCPPHLHVHAVGIGHVGDNHLHGLAATRAAVGRACRLLLGLRRRRLGLILLPHLRRGR